MIADDDLAPLILADGTRIDPTTGKKLKDSKPNAKMIEVPAPSVAQELVIKARKSVAELPLPPAQMSGIALVAFYTLYGLTDIDIAIACDNRVTVKQIANIRKNDTYIEFMQAARTAILETEQNTVRGIMQTHSTKAAEKIIALADSDNDVLAFKASQDVLDRAGHRPADIVEHRHRMEDALQIVVTTRDTVQAPVTIDLDMVVVKE